jgi:hypothetical protein
LNVLIQRVDVGSLFETFQICDQKLTPPSKTGKFTIQKQQIEDFCKDKKDTDRNLVVALYSDTNTDENLKVMSLVQYSGMVMALPDGIAYRTTAMTSEIAIGFYYY